MLVSSQIVGVVHRYADDTGKRTVQNEQKYCERTTIHFFTQHSGVNKNKKKKKHNKFAWHKILKQGALIRKVSIYNDFSIWQVIRNVTLMKNQNKFSFLKQQFTYTLTTLIKLNSFE